MVADGPVAKGNEGNRSDELALDPRMACGRFRCWGLVAEGMVAKGGEDNRSDEFKFDSRMACGQRSC